MTKSRNDSRKKRPTPNLNRSLGEREKIGHDCRSDGNDDVQKTSHIRGEFRLLVGVLRKVTHAGPPLQTVRTMRVAHVWSTFLKRSSGAISCQAYYGVKWPPIVIHIGRLP